MVDVETWPLRATARVFVSIVDGEGSQVFAIPENPPGAANDSVEIAGGLERPVAMTVGLDGSL